MQMAAWAGESERAELIDRAANAMSDRLVAQRRDLHQHPELSNREERTARVVVERLRALGFEDIRTNVAGHGVVAMLRGKLPGAVVAVRADMDALPITETNDVPYKSLVPGVKHACGHDAHTAIELGVAELLAGMRDRMRGSVKFIFQPAEEAPPAGEEGGAALMVKEGVLENPRPSAIFALHVSPELEAGIIGYRAGGAQAAGDSFDIVIHGKMGHTAFPQRGIDAIVVAAECVSALQTIKSRRIDSLEPIILTIGTIHGGNRRNVMTDEVKMEGTVRTLNEETRGQVEKLMRETLAGVSSVYGATYEMKYEHGAMGVFNDPKLVAGALPSMRRAAGDTQVIEVPPRMGADDFSCYQQVIPAFLFRLGSANKARGIAADVHTPGFDIDERCLVLGVKTMANILLDYLDTHEK